MDSSFIHENSDKGGGINDPGHFYTFGAGSSQNDSSISLINGNLILNNILLENTDPILTFFRNLS